MFNVMDHVNKARLNRYYCFIFNFTVECAGGIFDYNRPGVFAGCTIITGSLRIPSASVPANTE